MDIELRPVGSIKPYERNPRRNDAGVDAVAESIRQFGFRQPIVVNSEGVIVCGHTRWKAAKKLGLKEIPVHVARDLTPEQVAAYRVTDNKTAELSNWDLDALSAELAALPAIDWNSLGFKEWELAHLLHQTSNADLDKVAEPPEEAITRSGDLWILGDHRLLCGDSTKAEDVARVMGRKKADLCFTSPPYAQQRDYGAKVTDWDGLMRNVFGNLPMADAGQVLVNLGLVHKDGEWWPYWNEWITWMREQGWRRFGWYVWDQGPGLPGDWNGRLAPAFEFIFHFNRKSIRAQKTQDCINAGKIYEGKGGLRGKDGVVTEWSHRNQPVQNTKIADSVCRISREKSSYLYGHVAMFSLGFATYFIESWLGDVYDPFLGSGTTLIACEQLGRRCYALEIEPRYVDVAVARWEKFTGRKAERCSGHSCEQSPAYSMPPA